MVKMDADTLGDGAPPDDSVGGRGDSNARGANHLEMIFISTGIAHGTHRQGAIEWRSRADRGWPPEGACSRFSESAFTRQGRCQGISGFWRVPPRHLEAFARFEIEPGYPPILSGDQCGIIEKCWANSTAELDLEAFDQLSGRIARARRGGSRQGRLPASGDLRPEMVEHSADGQSKTGA